MAVTEGGGKGMALLSRWVGGMVFVGSPRDFVFSTGEPSRLSPIMSSLNVLFYQQ